MGDNVLLFVYGQSKKGGLSHERLKSAEFLGTAFIKGYKLYILRSSKYPAVTKSDDINDKVYGEVYNIIDKKMIENLDNITGAYRYYDMKKTVGYLGNNNKQVDIVFYEYVGNVTNCIEVKDGKWKIV